MEPLGDLMVVRQAMEDILAVLQLTDLTMETYGKLLAAEGPTFLYRFLVAQSRREREDDKEDSE